MALETSALMLSETRVLNTQHWRHPNDAIGTCKGKPGGFSLQCTGMAASEGLDDDSDLEYDLAWDLRQVSASDSISTTWSRQQSPSTCEPSSVTWGMQDTPGIHEVSKQTLVLDNLVNEMLQTLVLDEMLPTPHKTTTLMLDNLVNAGTLSTTTLMLDNLVNAGASSKPPGLHLAAASAGGTQTTTLMLDNLVNAGASSKPPGLELPTGGDQNEDNTLAVDVDVICARSLDFIHVLPFVPCEVPSQTEFVLLHVLAEQRSVR